MAVLITQQPSEIAFSGNPILFKYQSDNVVAAEGRPYVGKLQFVSVPVVGQGFTLKYGKLELPFSFTAAVDDSGLLLPTDAGWTMLVFLQNLRDEMDRNFYINRDFIVEVDTTGTPVLKLTARENDPAFNLTLTTDFAISLLLVQDGVSDSANSNFKVMVQLWVQTFDSAEFTAGIPQLLELDENGETYYDFADAINTALCKNGYDRPNLALAEFAKANKNVCKYYIKYAEVYGTPQLTKRTHATATKYATLGGFSKALLETETIADYFVTGGKVKFLKQSAATEKIKPHPSAKDYLYWLNILDADTADVWVTVTFSDNSVSAPYSPAGFVGLNKFDKLIIPCGFLDIQAHLQDLVKIPVKYSVVLKSGGVEISETKTFLVDYEPQPYTRFYVALNSFGGYDGRFTYGKGSREYDILQESASRALIGNFSFQNGEQTVFYSISKHKEQVTTGYKSKRELYGWEEFFQSRDKFNIRNGFSYPVELASKNIKTWTDGDTLTALSFELGYTYTDEFFSIDEHPDDQLTFEQILGWVPPVSNPDPDNFDDRYYLKAEVYNKAQIDALNLALQNQFSALDASVTSQIADMLLALQDKADVGHDHTGLYVTIGEFLTGMGQVYEDCAHKTTLDITEALTIDWQNDVILDEDITYAEKHGNDLFSYASWFNNGATWEVFSGVQFLPTFNVDGTLLLSVQIISDQYPIKSIII